MNMTKSLEIDSLTLQSWLENGQPVEVIDIRPRVDYEAWHVPGSLNVDAYQAIYANSPGPLADYAPPDDRPVVAVCYVGQTSRIAAKYLQSRGIRAVSLTGGMQAWSLSWNVAEVKLPGGAASILQVRRTGKGCLSYLVFSGREALVIDPSLDPHHYAQLAEARESRIVHVVDTHIHADHLSRSRALAELTGARYSLPRQDRAQFDHDVLQAGDVIGVGTSRLEVIHSPGHTFESVSLLLDKAALFTGDTLFLDSIGRPDLKAGREETAARARALHQTLQRLAALDPEVLVLPCHTGRPVPFDHVPVAGPLKDVREKIEALHMPEDQFVSWILGRIPPNPPNYETIVRLNERGILPELDPTMLEAGANQCAI
jgi:glyoxylase-like metal-dependent hydrolase (beta-lactamase superfamily II)